MEGAMQDVHSRWVDNDVWEVKETHNRAPRSGFHACPPPKRRPRSFMKGMLCGGGLTIGLWLMIIGLFWNAR